MNMKLDRKIIISATFTADPVADTLSYWLRELKLPLDFEFTPYNQVFQELIGDRSQIATNRSGFNVFLIRFEDWLGDGQSHGLVEATLKRNIHDFCQAIKVCGNKLAVPHLVVICPASRDIPPDRARLFGEMECLMETELSQQGNIHLTTPEEQSQLYPVPGYDNPHGNEIGHIPYIQSFFTALGTMIIRRITCLMRRPYKVIVLDCDQTLWGGICGEDGHSGIEITKHFRALQEFMVAKHEVGMVLCLCSKNNKNDVLKVFENRPEMPLKLEHFAAIRINWQSKSENIISIANELELGLDSFIFIDDNPLECIEVRVEAPEILVLQLPTEQEKILLFLQHVWGFDHLVITAEDRMRNQYYKQNSQRERMLKESISLDDFLAGLNLRINISPLTPTHLPRVSQLTQRTNQFNATSIRRSEEEINCLCQDSRFSCLVVDVSDRFGDYGLCGVVLYKISNNSLDVDTFLLSCRVLGRGIEYRVLAKLGELALDQAKDCVRVKYSPTAKNQPVLNFLNMIGEQVQVQDENGFIFLFPAITGEYSLSTATYAAYLFSSGASFISLTRT